MSTLEFYMTRVAQCERDADASTLDNVRERHLRARAAWLDMAERLERTQEGRAATIALKEAQHALLIAE